MQNGVSLDNNANGVESNPMSLLLTHFICCCFDSILLNTVSILSDEQYIKSFLKCVYFNKVTPLHPADFSVEDTDSYVEGTYQTCWRCWRLLRQDWSSRCLPSWSVEKNKIAIHYKYTPTFHHFIIFFYLRWIGLRQNSTTFTQPQRAQPRQRSSLHPSRQHPDFGSHLNRNRRSASLREQETSSLAKLSLHW